MITPKISGVGVLSCAGNSLADVWENSLSGQSFIESGLGPIREEAIHQVIDSVNNTKLRAVIEQCANRFDENRALALSLLALDQCLSDAGWEELREDDGLIFATTTGQLCAWEPELIKELTGSSNRLKDSLGRKSLGTLQGAICRSVDFSGREQHITSACSASTHALALARIWLMQGKVKRCLVGATETLSRLTTEGFASFQLLTKDVCKPFSKERAGINLSEASVFLSLEPTDESKPSIAGVGFSTDGFHLTSPHPEGLGSYRAMKEALEDANIQADKVDWVYAHGTGSPQNDSAEALAIQKLFGSDCPPVSSTKAIHGHCLAASGLMEVALSVAAVYHQTILPNTNAKPVDEALRLPVVQTPIKSNLKYILKNTLGFGGSNGAILISAEGGN